MSTRVMIVDDDPDIRTIVRVLFEQDNYEVATAADGEEALALVGEFQPELIILDVMMPGIDGYQVCEELKKSFETAHIPIILLTAKQDIMDLEKGVKHSIDDYVAKPFSHRELLARAKMVLARTRYQMGCNPLTGLPGNLEIEHRIKELVRTGDDFSLYYLDIDGFKAFNDYYGYARGDLIIKLAANCLVRTTRELGEPGDFVGHVGGDDFVVIVKRHSDDKLAEHIIELFEKEQCQYYDDDDLERGYFEIKDRTGHLRRFPIKLTLTVVVVTNERRSFETFAEIAGVQGELKKFGKGKPGSVIVHERRSDDDLDDAGAAPEMRGRGAADGDEA
jgi:diguanylate cyclase (GGDEF)-like protein